MIQNHAGISSLRTSNQTLHPLNVFKGSYPLTSSLCVMSRSDTSYGLILASSPIFKEVFGKSNVSRARDLSFFIESRKFNYQKWYEKHTDIHGQRTEPTIEYVAFIESWRNVRTLSPHKWPCTLKKIYVCKRYYQAIPL